MARQITWVLSSENGKYNPTFRFDILQSAFDVLARYWDIDFVRINNYGAARVKIIQSASQYGPATYAAWANKGNLTIKISPSFNFKKYATVCSRVILHEFMHLAGSGSHLSDPKALMCDNAGTGGNITQPDYAYMPYAWRGALRPHQEPNYLRDKFTVLNSMGPEEVGDTLMQFGCTCSSGILNKILPARFLAP
jgi:hypothetical protein